MTIERDVKVDSPDNAYNGQLRLLIGQVALVAGQAVQAMPSVKNGEAVLTYAGGGVPANQGFLSATYNTADRELEIQSSNVADTSTVIFFFFVGEE